MLLNNNNQFFNKMKYSPNYTMYNAYQSPAYLSYVAGINSDG